MAKLEFYGRVKHYASNGSVVFYLEQYDPKKKDKEGSDVMSYSTLEIPFEIWSKFKDSDVKITIDKE